jgi:hypothetical protein
MDKQQTSILQSLWLEPTIYRTQGEHANNYSINALPFKESKIHVELFSKWIENKNKNK